MVIREDSDSGAIDLYLGEKIQINHPCLAWLVGRDETPHRPADLWLSYVPVLHFYRDESAARFYHKIDFGLVLRSPEMKSCRLNPRPLPKHTPYEILEK